MSLRGKKNKGTGMRTENKIIVIAILAAVMVFVLWWFYGYHYIIVPSGELSFRAP